MLYVIPLLFVFALSCSRNPAPVAPAGKQSCAMCGLFGGEHEVREGSRPAISAGSAVVVAGEDTPATGPERTVRIVYFRPNDRPFRQTLADSIVRVMKQSQSFFAEQMAVHGHGDQTFRLETDEHGEPLVYLFNAEHPAEYYADSRSENFYRDSEQYGKIRTYLFEIASVFDLDENIYVVVRDFTKRPRNTPQGARRSKKGGNARTPPWGVNLKTMAHELGHAFGLPHDFRDDRYMLSYGTSRDRISACAAQFLSMHPYFNDTISWENSSPPIFDLMYPTLPGSSAPFRLPDNWVEFDYPSGLESITIRFRVSDSDGIDQIIFGAAPGWGYLGARECRSYSGEESIIVEYEFDGSSIYPEERVTDLDDTPHLMDFIVVDSDGNMTDAEFVLKLEDTQWSLAARADTPAYE